MKLLIGVLFPALAAAGVAGDYTGTLNFPKKSLQFVVHLKGPDNELKATFDSPDQHVFRMPVDSISLSDTSLKFATDRLGIRFSGDVNANGTIVGTFTQHATALPLILTRTDAPALPPHVVRVPGGWGEDGRYVDQPSGIAFSVPSGWSIADVRAV